VLRVYVCQGITKVVAYVHKKQRHPRVIWVNLRDDVTVQCDLVTYSVRDTAALEEPIVLPAATGSDIEVVCRLLSRDYRRIEQFKTVSGYSCFMSHRVCMYLYRNAKSVSRTF